MNDDLLADALRTAPEGVTWSAAVTDHGGAPAARYRAAVQLATASVGKILLLVALARRIAGGEIDPGEPLDRRSVDPVADSGIWQHLDTDVLPAADVATLVGSVSDNLAANVLAHRVGLDAARREADRLGLADTALLDFVRDSRGPDDPPTLSVGTGSELAMLMHRLAGGEECGPRVLGWLSAGVDLSMVGAAFGFDPLAHGEPDRGLRLVNKTGTDTGVRADVGVVSGPGRTLAYGVIANWQPSEFDDPVRDGVLAAFRRVGELLRAAVI